MKWYEYGFKGGKIPPNVGALDSHLTAERCMRQLEKISSEIERDWLDCLARNPFALYNIAPRFATIYKENRMGKYTRDDVIVTRKQAEEAGLKKGMTVYGAQMPKNCTDGAERDSELYRGELERIDWSADRPFRIKLDSPTTFGPFVIDVECVVIKKKPKYEPFDLRKEEDIAMLRGRSIKKNLTLSSREELIFFINENIVKTITGPLVPEELVKDYTFADGPHKGEPVGKKVE